MRKQTTFLIVAAILLTAIVSVVLYNVKTTNAQGNMSSASGANMTKGNMTAAGAAKNMTSNMSSAAKAMNHTK
jgi:preprotein translocase subunit SecG